MNPTIAALLRSAAWTIPGNIGNDPEIRFLNSGTAVCNFNLAVNKPGAKKGDGSQPDWFKVEIWGDQAQAAADTLRKGSRCVVVGRVRTETWTGRDGEERTTTVLRAEEWFQEWNSPAPTSAATPAAKPAAAAAAAPAAWQSSADDDIDDVPF